MMIILKVWSYFFIIWSIIDKNLEKDQIIFEVRDIINGRVYS